MLVDVKLMLKGQVVKSNKQGYTSDERQCIVDLQEDGLLFDLTVLMNTLQTRL